MHFGKVGSTRFNHIEENIDTQTTDEPHSDP